MTRRPPRSTRTATLFPYTPRFRSQPAATPTGAPSPATSLFLRGPVIVTRFAGANAIVIGGNADTQRMLGEVIRQLDVAREQVLVEAIIVEISDNAAKRLGVQFLLGGDPSSGEIGRAHV